jgi:hypothetical protein
MPYAWDAGTARYRGPSGRFVPDSQAREALDAVIDVQAQQLRTLTERMLNGQIALSEWQRQAMQAIKMAHLDGLALARGGWQQLDQADFGWVGQRIRQQYSYLANFAQQLADGTQPAGSGAVARAAMYAEAGRSTHREAQRRLAKDRGMEQERNFLHSADHCPGCLSETARGWVELGTLVPVGSRSCLSRCRCTLSYRTPPAPQEETSDASPNTTRRRVAGRLHRPVHALDAHQRFTASTGPDAGNVLPTVAGPKQERNGTGRGPS